MGVVHKFKQEVIDFIINNKMDLPTLSCRKITDLVNDKFQLDVSKSAVNNILKKEKLSSSVGRRARVVSFQIPIQKKQQLYHNIKKHDKNEEIAISAEEGVQKKEKDNNGFSLEGFSKKTEAEQLFYDQIDAGRQARFKSFNNRLNNLGILLFNAFQCDFDHSGALSKVLRKNIKGYVSKDFDEHLNFLLMQIVKTDDQEEKESQGDGFFNSLSFEALTLWKTALFAQKFPTSFFYEYFVEKGHIFSQQDYYLFQLQNGQSFYTDTAFHMCGLSKEELQAPSFYISKPIENISNTFLKANKYFCIRQCFNEETLKLLNANEEVDSHFEKIGVFNVKNEKIFEYSLSPDDEKFFIVAFFEGQREYAQKALACRDQKKQFYYDPFTDRVYTVKETITTGSQGTKMRVMDLQNKEAFVKILVMTNDLQSEIKIILREYLKHTPYPEVSNNQITDAVKSKRAQKQRFSEEVWGVSVLGINTLQLVIEDYLTAIKRHAAVLITQMVENVNDAASFLQVLYKLSGYVIEKSDRIDLYFDLTQQTVYKEKIQILVKKLSNRNIVNQKGQQYFFAVFKK